MRLYLSSYRLGDHAETLVALCGKNARAAVIANAQDLKDAPARAESETREIEALKALGFQTSALDLRTYFGQGGKDRLRKDLRRIDMVWVMGGNSFVLKRAYEQSGFDMAITEAVSEDRIVYAGYSAGICIAGPTLQGIEPCDEPDRVPAGYAPDYNPEGLGFVPYSIIPHFRCGHHESPLMEKVLDDMLAARRPFRVLADGEVIVVDTDEDGQISDAMLGKNI